MNRPRMTLAMQLVLAALLEDPGQERYGLEIGHAAGLPSGTIHPILARLEGVGWLQSRWEDVDPRLKGRPLRRYYSLTPLGAESAPEALSRVARTGRGPASMRPAVGGS